MPAIREPQTNTTPLRRRQRQRRQFPILLQTAVLFLLALFSSSSTIPVPVVQALHISYALTSDTALRVVQNMASIVAAPPNKSRARVFANLKDRRSREDKAINGDYLAAAVNGDRSGSSHTTKSNHGQHHTTTDSNNSGSTIKVVVPESGVVESSSTTTIESTLSNLKETDRVELEVNGKKITPRPVTLQSIAWGIPQDANPKEQVWTALSKLESNMEMLDEIAGQKQQLNALEVSLLSGCILAAAAAPIMGGTLTEFIAPSAAACCAAIGIGAEYVGKTAVADGKEVAAISIQCAAEAEAVLAQAERSKAIAPLCVGVGATSATCSLLIPAVLEASGLTYTIPGVRELYLLCPVAAILSAAIAGLSFQETRQFCNRAIGVGNRRFARSGAVGRTWMSASEQISKKSETGRKKLSTFTLSVLPAPLLGVLIPGTLATKTIAISAIAAAESAFFLTQAEFTLARAVDAVALKTRSAAVCDTYANQGSRSSAILPFTSALSALCAATTAAVVELPFFEASTSAVTVAGQVVGITVFPALAALFAGAASVSKARCELDADAAMEAASTLAVEFEEGSKSPIIQPNKAVLELIRLSVQNSVARPLRRIVRRMSFVFRFPRRWFFRRSLRRAFSLFDNDRDGILSATELRRCVYKLGVLLTDDEVNSMIEEYDQDGDGKINYAEFRRMMISA